MLPFVNWLNTHVLLRLMGILLALWVFGKKLFVLYCILKVLDSLKCFYSYCCSPWGDHEYYPRFNCNPWNSPVVSLWTTNVKLMVVQEKKTEDYQRHYCLWIMNVCKKFKGNPSNSCLDITVWTKLVDRATDRPVSAIKSHNKWT